MYTYNFGTGGATINGSLVETEFSLLDELNEYYLPIYTKDEDAATWYDNTTLFIIWVGINDINRSYMKEHPDMNPMIIDNYRRFIDSLYDREPATICSSTCLHWKRPLQGWR